MVEGHAWQGGGHAWQGDMHDGGMHGRGVCIVGGHVWQWDMPDKEHAWWGACVVEDMHSRRDGHCSGRYASYWNAFLLTLEVYFK